MNKVHLYLYTNEFSCENKSTYKLVRSRVYWDIDVFPHLVVYHRKMYVRTRFCCTERITERGVEV